MKRTMLAIALALLAACSSRGQGGPALGDITLCIDNAAVGYGNFVAYAGSTRFTVYPGEEVCKEVRATGPNVSVRAASSGGGITGPLRFAFQIPSLSDCWYWRVSTSAVLDLTPCDDVASRGARPGDLPDPTTIPRGAAVASAPSTATQRHGHAAI